MDIPCTSRTLKCTQSPHSKPPCYFLPRCSLFVKEQCRWDVEVGQLGVGMFSDCVRRWRGITDII